MKLLLSQLAGLISATWETRDIHIKVVDPGQDWDAIFNFTGIPLEAGTYPIKNCQVALTWSNSVNTGQQDQGLMLSFDEVEVRYAGGKRYLVPSGIVFDFQGSNCNDKTRFLYYLMGNRVKVSDDVGVLGCGSQVEHMSLCQMSPSAHFKRSVQKSQKH